MNKEKEIEHFILLCESDTLISKINNFILKPRIKR